tara:strand:- start:1754 stop:2056 length:303 start_codon:yes stop_codon:yes gene_type:complete
MRDLMKDINWRIGNNADGLFIKKQQEIPDDFLTANKNARIQSSNAPMGNYHKLASIPVIVADKWMKEGFNIYDGSVTPKEIIKKLKEENLEAFLTSNKSI